MIKSGTDKIKNIIMFQLVVIIYTLSSVIAKFSSDCSFLSFNFIILYGLEILTLGIYAVLWQQIIKKVDLSIAYANRSTALLWSLIWAVIFFKDTITIKNIIGVMIVIIGTILVNSDDN